MGDPQAPFTRVLELLDRHKLLDASGSLRREVQLVSMGDHFDWGLPGKRVQATQDALALLAWLSAHASEQVVILAGNHDLARVCELSAFTDDALFETAYAEAIVASSELATDEAKNQFKERYPSFSDAQSLARDFSCYSAAQQRVVTELLRRKRFRLAHHHAELLLVHAGVTVDDFALLGEVPVDARAAAQRLNDFFDERIERWNEGPLDLFPLHQPGSAQKGLARGILFHRPAMPSEDSQFTGPPPRRRYDPRQLPVAFPQAIGHIRDRKARELLGSWADDSPAVDGPLRALSIEGEQVRYARGTPPNARLYFLDGGLLHAHLDRYELFDLETRAPLQLPQG